MKRGLRFKALAWAGLLLLLGAYLHLAFRQDSSFFTVWWMPRDVARLILRYTDYRNLWGFGLLGFYAGLALGTWWWVRRGGRWQWGTLALWLVPVLKEVIQAPIPGRHGTVSGALYGLAGAMLGGAMGCGLRVAIVGTWRKFAGRVRAKRSECAGEAKQAEI